ncbi:MAG: HEPN domain-containing protein [Chlamydiae bacterium]|nr:MAG: HEPN domain-containing protein [Chlamydiota bacterium]
MKKLDEYIKYRMKQAKQAFEEAELMAEHNHWNACVNRLYYSCFNAVNALLIKNELSSSKHSGVLSLFNLHFVKTGEILKEDAKIYNKLFNKRNDSDYVDFVEFDEQTVKPWINQTQTFIKVIEEQLN